MERIKGSRHNTLVNIVNEYMGSQWALFMPTVVKAPLLTHVFVYNVHKGVMAGPFDWLLTNSNV